MSNITLSVACDQCGEELEVACLASNRRHEDMVLRVTPCPKCLAEAKDKGYDEGHDAGYEDGLTEGNNG